MCLIDFRDGQMSSAWEDMEVLREVWAGRVPAVFTLAESECEGSGQPEPCYLMLPRVSYLPLATEKVRKHFSSFLPGQSSDTMWFSYGGTPLRWHLPIGLLYDLMVLSSEPASLPWHITAHFTQFPSDQLLPCQGREQVRRLRLLLLLRSAEAEYDEAD